MAHHRQSNPGRCSCAAGTTRMLRMSCTCCMLPERLGGCLATQQQSLPCDNPPHTYPPTYAEGLLASLPMLHYNPWPPPTNKHPRRECAGVCDIFALFIVLLATRERFVLWKWR